MEGEIFFEMLLDFMKFVYELLKFVNVIFVIIKKILDLEEEICKEVFIGDCV